MTKLKRRETLALGGATFLSELLLGGAFASAQTSDTLTIAYNVNLPSFDPTVGPSAVNPTIQAIYRAIYDQYVGQNPDLSFAPGLLTKWGWNDDKTKAWMDVREGVVWHDGSPLTPADVVWSLERAGEAGKAGRRERMRDPEDADEEQEGRDHLEHEGRHDVVLAEIARAPAVLAESACPALCLARQDESTMAPAIAPRTCAIQ